MAMKNLRSLIHEKLSLDLRVELDLLSRRRDIVNEEKQEELLKLLRKNNIEGIVQLGPGTNRYAIKLDGFVVKIATDHDGKIDNFKEFKMSKRLQPHVTRTYEVSQNGTLLVAEYIQPFQSYSEMLKYAEKIKDILKKFSSVYLIGDVGISTNNFANWGLRVGSEDPVCLDFAYVYEVSSEIFICRYCSTNSMLVPNNDFTGLICSNPTCGKRYSFEDIRARIGNDVHRHEIGDLTEEGYLMNDSNILTELTPQRSNYLMRKKSEVKAKEEVKEEEHYSPFVMEHEPSYYIKKEEEEMNSSFMNMAASMIAKNGGGNSQLNSRIIPAKEVISVDDVETTDPIPAPEPVGEDESNVDIVEGIVESVSDEGLAFSGKITEQKHDVSHLKDEKPAVTHEQQKKETSQPEETTVSQEETVEPEVPQEEEPKHQEEAEEEVEVEVVTGSVITEKPEPSKKTEPAKLVTDKKPENDQKQEVNEQVEDSSPDFSENFKKNANRAFSKVTNMIREYLHCVDAFNTVKGYIKDKKMYPESFYKNVQNAMYRSLVMFCGFTEKDVPAGNGTNGTKRIFVSPKFTMDMDCADTAVFVDRLWNDKRISSIEDPRELIETYHKLYGNDHNGIQKEWLEPLRKRMVDKMRTVIDKNGIDIVINIISEAWIASDEVEDEAPEPVTPNDPPQTNEAEQAAVSQEETVEPEVPQEEEPKHQEEAEEEVEEVDPLVSEEYHNVQMSTIYGSMGDAMIVPAGEEDEEADEDGDEDEEDEYEEGGYDVPTLTVEIYPEDNFDIIKVISKDVWGDISIPIYTNIDASIDATPSMIDDRNGVWDWLVHMVPDIMFTTKDPEEWLAINDIEAFENQPHIVILDINEDDEYIMGVFQLYGIYVVDSDWNYHFTANEELLQKLNTIISQNIGLYNISHLRRSLSMTELIRTEEYVRAAIQAIQCLGGVDEIEVGDNVEQAAIDALLSMGSTMREPQEEETSEEEIEESVAEDEPQKPEPPQAGTLKVMRRKGGN